MGSLCFLLHCVQDVDCSTVSRMLFAPPCSGCCLLHRVLDVFCSTVSRMLFAPPNPGCCSLHYAMYVVCSAEALMFFFFLLCHGCYLRHCVLDVVGFTVSWTLFAPLCTMDVVRFTTPLMLFAPHSLPWIVFAQQQPGCCWLHNKLFKISNNISLLLMMKRG